MAENPSNGPSGAGPAAAAKAPAPAQARQIAAQAAQRSKPGKLPGKLAADLGQSLGGHDMDGVDVHTDAAAAEAAGALNAKAFAVGKAMFFGEGQYNPDSKEGQHLIAHEAAHTAQQSGSDAGIPQLASMDVSSPGDKHEVEAESFADSFSKGGKGSVSPVSKGSVSRSIIQRDLLDGKGPELPPPAPINAHEASPSDLTHGASEAIKNARAAGGTNAVVAKVHELRNGANDKTRNAVESAISSTLSEDEKNALDGKTSQAPAAGGEPGAQTKGAPQNKAPEQAPKKASDKPGADKGGEGGGGGADPASEDKGAAGGGKGGDKHDAKGGDAKNAPAGTGGAHKPEPSKEPAHAGGDHEPAGGDHEHKAPHVPEAAGRELIEQELAFHEKWAMYSNGGAGARAGGLLKGLVTTDAVEGGKGALTQVLMGQGMKLAVTKTALGKIPGVGNIIGGAFSAYNLFSNGGAGIKKMGGEAIEGIGGAFSAQNWKDSPWLTAANLVAGIQATLELIGNVCQILSGLAYAFAAIAALGGLLSIFFPPLAFLVPYIPTAINFGRACGGIATVCFSVASLISPISPLLRAIHLIFSNQDPIKLVEEDKKFHEQAQGAMANYAAATANSAIDSKGKSFNPVNKMLGEMHEGADAAKESMHKGAVKEVGEDMQMPEMELKGAKDKAMAGGVKENLPGNHADKAADANKIGKDYFNPDERAKPLEDKVAKEEDRVKTTEDTAHRREAELDKAKEKLADDNNRPNRRAVQLAERRLEKAEGKVAAAEAAKEDAEGHLAVGGRNNAGGAQGNVGDTSNGARGRLNENGEEKKIETAAEA
ncbi:MAG: DUF4157 domain-containing protein, partial [Deltaproteobacteria bacterium]|nr:DUF4157 domain-containing protein [Deltaproteobacteria bacterium]